MVGQGTAPRRALNRSGVWAYDHPSRCRDGADTVSCARSDGAMRQYAWAVPTAAEPGAVSRVYLDSPYASIRWEPEQQWVTVEWRGSASTPEFRAAHETTLAAIHDNQALRFLADLRQAGQVLGEDKRWLEEQIVPRFAVSGVRWLATVMPAEQVARASLAKVARTPPSDQLQRAEFRILDDAKVWLSFVGTEQ